MKVESVAIMYFSFGSRFLSLGFIIFVSCFFDFKKKSGIREREEISAAMTMIFENVQLSFE